MVAALALIARLVLATVFAVAGTAKLADREGTREAAVGFGAAEWLAAPLAILLPVIELTVAVLLLPSETAVAGAIGAASLLLLFSVAIARSLAQGHAPDCHCFGQLHSAPTSSKTLARNGGLAAIAVFALWASVREPETSALAWIGRLGGAELLALVVGAVAATVVVVGTTAFLSLMRSYGQVLVRLDNVESALTAAGIATGPAGDMPELGLEPGTPAPAFATMSATGQTVTLEQLLTPGLPLLLLFTSPECGPCKGLIPLAAEWQREHADTVAIAFASDGTHAEVRAEAKVLGLQNALVDDELKLYQAFEANGTPSAVLIAPDGTIGSWVAPGREWIEHLFEHAAEGGDEETGLPVGTEAPSFELPTPDGARLSLADLRGQDTLLLFWNPECEFCRAMHEDLVAWEKTNGHEKRLLVVSSGSAESTRAEGFRSRVVVDESFAAGAAFGIDGTPMAVLVGRDGRVASRVASGADAVLALANGQV